MKPFLKILLLLLTTIPIFYFSFFLYTFGFNKDLVFDNFDLIMKLHVLMFPVSIILLISYIVLLFKNKSITESRRTQWLLLIIFGNAVAMIFYWFIHLRPWKKVESITEI